MAESKWVMTHEQFVNLLQNGECEYIGGGGLDVEGRTIEVSDKTKRQEYELGLKDN